MKPEASWDEGAEAWTQFVRSGEDYYRTLVHGPALLASCGEVADLSVLDLGCGEGYFSRELARVGADVVGVDLSRELVQRAHEYLPEQAIRFVHGDAREVSRLFGQEQFDLVASCMAVHDMDGVEEVLHAVRDVLRPDGRFVFSVPHPGTDTPYREWERGPDGEKLALKIDRYFETGPSVTDWCMPRLQYRWKTPHWKRTLTEWSRLLRTHGFSITGLEEPRPSEETLRRDKRLADCARVPYFLIWSTSRA